MWNKFPLTGQFVFSFYVSTTVFSTGIQFEPIPGTKKYTKKKTMQQQNIFSYSFSENEKNKKYKQDRKPQARKKAVSYIDIKYVEKTYPLPRNEMDKDIVF